MLYAIAAMDRKGCIGKAGELPWRIPADLAMFKKLTEGCIVLMGRKTYESIPKKHRPLPNRVTIVCTRVAEKHGNTEVHDSGSGVALFTTNAPEAAASIASGSSAHDIVVCGGAETYEAVRTMIDGFYVTAVDTEVDCGDAHFQLEPTFELKFSKPYVAPEGDVPGYQFQYWEPKK